MASTTLSLSDCTWFQIGDSTNHYGDTWLKCSAKTRCAVLQFTLPNNLKYKRFTSAILSYYSRHLVNGTPSNEKFIQGMYAYPYIISSSDIDQVNGTNYQTVGDMGEELMVETVNASNPQSTWVYYPRWRTADLTSIFASNLYNNSVFTAILAGYPGINNDTTRAGDVGGTGSGYAPYITLTYEDVTQDPPTPTYPADTYVNENTDISFAWAWNSSTAAVQASVQLEYKLKTAQTYTTVSLTQTTHTYKLAGGLAQGVYEWRLKGTNDAGDTSAYSSVVEFTVVGKPVAPVINEIPNKTLTEITWNTTDQNAFDITITDANGKLLVNESVASMASIYRPNIFLKGSYTVGIRTKNSTGLMSEWSYKVFNITAAGPTKPTAQLYQNDVKVTITADIADETSYAVIRKEDREGTTEKILGYLQNGSFVDTTWGFGIPYKYVVRAWTTGGYTDSDPMRTCYKKTAVVLETDEDEIILDRSEEKFLPFAEEISGEMAIFNCVGRELPIVEHGDNGTRAFRSRLHVREDQMERLVAMTKKNKIFYRDYSGRAFPVAINPPLGISRYMNSGYMADIQFVRISDEEVVVNV